MQENINILDGREEARQLNGHKVVVVVPTRKISYEDGVKEMEKIIDKVRARNP